jgi:hypothetical protein
MQQQAENKGQLLKIRLMPPMVTKSERKPSTTHSACKGKPSLRSAIASGHDVGLCSLVTGGVWTAQSFYRLLVLGVAGAERCQVGHVPRPALPKGRGIAKPMRAKR